MPRRRAAVGWFTVPISAAIPAAPAPDLSHLTQPVPPRKAINAAVWSPSYIYISWDEELLPDEPDTLGDVTAYAMLIGDVTAWAELIVDVDASA